MDRCRVLFVCMGNICRSPAGEGVLRHLVEQRGLQDRIEVDSAGTLDYHVGEPPDSRMRSAASSRGYSLHGAARQFREEDFERFDLIVAMDRRNQRDVLARDTRGRFAHKVRLLCDFISNTPLRDVPDPYYGGPDGFEAVLDMIEEASESLLNHVLAGREAPRPAGEN